MTKFLPFAHVFALAVGLISTHLPASATEAEVRAEFARWMESCKQRDLAGTMAIFAPEVRFVYQGSIESDYRGLERTYGQRFKAAGYAEWMGMIDEVIVSGDLAVGFSTWQLIGRGGRVIASNRSVDIFHRDAGGKWRIIRSIDHPVKPLSDNKTSSDVLSELRFGCVPAVKPFSEAFAWSRGR
jgi:ketosteroid isomerase-like protein